MLLTHMQRFTYSATGALRWKRDVTEYADVLRNSHSPTTNAQVGANILLCLWSRATPVSCGLLRSLECASCPISFVQSTQ